MVLRTQDGFQQLEIETAVNLPSTFRERLFKSKALRLLFICFAVSFAIIIWLDIYMIDNNNNDEVGKDKNHGHHIVESHINQSPNDERDYKYITLSNQLQVNNTS